MLRELERAANRVTFARYEYTHGAGSRPRENKEFSWGHHANHGTYARSGRLADRHERREQAGGKVYYAIGFAISHA